MNTDSQPATPIVVLLVDETAAMRHPVRGGKKSRSEATATAINSLLKQLTEGSACRVAVSAYRIVESGECEVVSRWAGSLAGESLVATDVYADATLSIEQRTRRIPDASGFGVEREETVEFPIWYQPDLSQDEAVANAPEVAIRECQRQVETWTQNESSDTPALVVHITSGCYSGQAIADAVGNLVSNGTSLMHIEIGMSTGAPPICFPANRDFLPAGHATEWFELTSLLTDSMVDSLQGRGVSVNYGAHGLVLQGGLKELLDAFTALRAFVENPTSDTSEPAQTAPVSNQPVTPIPTIAEPPAIEPNLTPPNEVREDSAAPGESIAPEELPSELLRQPADSGDPEKSEPELVASEPTTPAELPAAPAEPEPPADSAMPERRGLLMLVVDRSLQDPVAPPTNDVYTRLKQQANDILTAASKTADGWLDVGLVTYGRTSSGAVEVTTRFFGGLSDHSIVTDRHLSGGIIRTEVYEEQMPNGIGGVISVKRQRPMYLELPPTEQASCVEAFQAVAPLVGGWCSRHRGQCAAPVVVHLTRGAISQRDLRSGLKKLKDVRSTAGPVLVHHLVLTETPGPAAAYPADCTQTGPSELRFFCELSSPHVSAELLATKHRQIEPGSRGIVVNGTFDLAVEGLRHSLCPSVADTA